MARVCRFRMLQGVTGRAVWVSRVAGPHPPSLMEPVSVFRGDVSEHVSGGHRSGRRAVLGTRDEPVHGQARGGGLPVHERSAGSWFRACLCKRCAALSGGHGATLRAGGRCRRETLLRTVCRTPCHTRGPSGTPGPVRAREPPPPRRLFRDSPQRELGRHGGGAGGRRASVLSPSPFTLQPSLCPLPRRSPPAGPLHHGVFCGS